MGIYMNKGTYTTANSDLFWRVRRVHYKSVNKFKAKITFYYKSSNEVCLWFNPTGKAKNFKLLMGAVKHWVEYDPYGSKDV